MIAVSLSALALLRPTIRFSPYLIRQSVGTFIYDRNRTVATSYHTKATTIPTPKPASTLTPKPLEQEEPIVAESMATNPMPVLAKADPSGEVLEDLPKLSMADFQVYNRLAVMMDYYVSAPYPREENICTYPFPLA